jgi:Phosphotransferase enzyme family
VTEIPLTGGDVNPVVRVGDTVRRPPGPEAVRALLEWYEYVGFDGAPRFLGFDGQGREVLSFVEGEPAFPPVPSGDEAVSAIGQLLRRTHDAQEGFVPPVVDWDVHVPGPNVAAEVIGHCDLFWTNVIFRDGLPVALIDWELAAPVTRVLDVALAASGASRSTAAANGCGCSATATGSTRTRARPCSTSCWRNVAAD